MPFSKIPPVTLCEFNAVAECPLCGDTSEVTPEEVHHLKCKCKKCNTEFPISTVVDPESCE